jgi:hypothetical protein
MYFSATRFHQEECVSQIMSVVCTFMLFFSALSSPSDRFRTYKTVEAYEIRPGILMMPKYSEDGQVCEIELERQRYSSGKIYLGSSLSRKDINELADELVPDGERGPKIGEWDRITGVGRGMTTSSIYENVAIEIYSAIQPTSVEHETVVNNIAAAIKWKNRKCE